MIVKQHEMTLGLDGLVGFSSKQLLSPVVFRRCPAPNGIMPEGLAVEISERPVLKLYSLDTARLKS